MKKGFVLGLFFGLIIFSFLASVSAADLRASAENLVNQVQSVVEPIARFAFGDNLGWDSLFVKVLLFVILMLVLVSALEKMPLVGENSGVVWTIGVIIGILAMRLVTTEALLNFIWLPSGVVGMAMVTLLPLVIYFYFVESFQSHFLRQTAWILFGVIFIALSISRWDELQNTEGLVGFNLAWMYVAVAVIAFLSFLLDGTIQKYRAKLRAEKVKEGFKGTVARHLQNEMAKIQNGYEANPSRYQGTTPDGRGKIGTEAYMADMEYFKEKISRHL